MLYHFFFQFAHVSVFSELSFRKFCISAPRPFFHLYNNNYYNNNDDSCKNVILSFRAGYGMSATLVNIYDIAL